ncbi:MAG: hypothetical protein F2667_09800, partial [Actinobacteria bacterium]|nr:hypothetical protein [Actinomycetota bacterium]
MRRAIVAAAATLLLAPVAGSWAAWSDTAQLTGGTTTAYAVPKPVIGSCVVTGGALAQKTATITWPAVATPPLTYTATLVETGQTVSVSGTGATRTVAFSAGLLSTVLNQTYHVRIVAALPAPGTSWISTHAEQPV